MVSEGSTFVLRVPIVFAEASPVTVPANPVLQPGKKFILIVEDNTETAFIYQRYLGSAGFQTHCLASTDDAQRLLSTVRPSAIILDLFLGEETTWSFLRELKSRQDPIPVLVMSVSDDEHKIFGAGADAYLREPFYRRRCCLRHYQADNTH